MDFDWFLWDNRGVQYWSKKDESIWKKGIRGLFGTNKWDSIRREWAGKVKNTRRYRKNSQRQSFRTRQSKNSFFFIRKKTKTSQGKKRKIKSCVGNLTITKRQADKLGVAPYTRHSPLLEKCCLQLSATKSFQKAEQDMVLLTGVKVGHSTHHRKVQKIDIILPDVKQKLSEVAIDGGTIRLRALCGGKSYL